jgi:ABC-2 type transport system permease protein
MLRTLQNVYWLGTKELRSFARDYVLLAFVVWAFSLAIYNQAQSHAQELSNASIGLVDEDRSALSHRIASAFFPPDFKRPEAVAAPDVDRSMDIAQHTFIIDIPPNFERDVLAGRQPAIQVNVDATAMIQAGIGAGYIENITRTEIANFVSQDEGAFLARGAGIPASPVTLSARVAFNPNLVTAWFTSVMGIINNVTMLAIILAGAAVIREREHGTMDHLLAMPVTPFQIAMAKIWANALVITTAAALSLIIVVKTILAVPIAGSIPLFLVGVVLYLFFATAIGIFLGTVANSMPQLGLLYILVSLPMNMLSGSNTPLESMPVWLQTAMQASPSTHFVAFAQAILYRGAGLSTVWPRFLAVAIMAGLFLALTLLRFRSVTARTA